MEEDGVGKPLKDDPAQVELIFEHYFDRVFRYVFSRTNNRQVAEDLTSQIFFKILKALPRYQSNRPMAAWIFTIAKNTLFSHFRFSIHHPAQSLEAAGLSEVIPASGSERNSTDIDCSIDLEKYIHHLSRKDQELLRLRYAAGLSFSEVGAVLGKSPEAVKMAVHRIVRKLQNGMELTK